MKERIVKNWKSTISGIILELFAGILVWNGTITWTEFVAFQPFVGGLIWVKDSIFKK